MGVEARIVLYAKDQAVSERAANAAYARLAELDAVMSDYRADSELNRLAAAPAGTPVHVSRDLFDVMCTAKRVNEASSGAFDITIGPLVALWRDSRQSHQLPTAEQRASARQRVGFQHVSINVDDHTITLAMPGVQLDLGGIGKGFAAQHAINTLREHDITSALVALAGDIAVSDAPPHEDGWRIVIDHNGSAHTLELTNAAISTSGSNQQFITIDGTRYSHLIDPRTGLGLTTETIVSVIARGPNAGALADALSSAACVLGEDAAASMLEAFPECQAYFDAINESDTAAGTERSR